MRDATFFFAREAEARPQPTYNRENHVPAQLAKSSQPIAGYTLQERLGAGGYGEVWSAEAPGGLTKALKFVYGYLDEDRATREMKALNRIKEVRHPFLLSLERIEIVDGQLIIVTELADASLKDRFDECKKEGLPGIPRDELLAHIRDAADALDYMSDNASLQHLDVKPENLLLVGGRVKVADFGLVKRLQDVTESLMGGLTPLYAAPEVFDGRPSLFSDQYSLAIVFQEMLTGELPFPGTTPAQLATQHLHSKPRLTALSQSDRDTLYRALSKEAGDRFASCREMVEDLCRQTASVEEESIESNRSSEASSNSQSAGQATSSVEPQKTSFKSSSRRKARGPALPQHDSAPRTWNASPVEIDLTQHKLRPTLVLGLGGTAARVMQKLRLRLRDAFDKYASIPSMRMLLIDTDSRALTHATQGEGGVALDPNETMALPLRRPQDYRNSSSKLTRSISRRWLYNVPKSRQTEGMRPLGRLALLDHGSQFMERLHQEIQALMQPDNIKRSEEITGEQFDAQVPHIVVVSSISGGSGSGMLIDAGYAIRHVLADMGLPDSDITGLLSHATGRNPTANDLSNSSAYSCLSELAHFTRPDSYYPGEACCGLSPSAPGKGPFEDTYLVHLGDELSEAQFDERVDELAEYLYLDVATSCGTLFDKCRTSDRNEPKNDAVRGKIRTFGLCQIGLSQEELVATATESLCKRIVRCWLGEPIDENEMVTTPTSTTNPFNLSRTKSQQPVGAEVDEQANAQATELGISFDAINETTHRLVHDQLASQLGDTLKQILAEVAADTELANLYATVISALDEVLGVRDDDGELRNATVTALPEEIRSQVDVRAKDLGESAEHWIIALVDKSKYHLLGAQRAARWFENHTQSLREASLTMDQRLDEEITTMSQSLIAMGVPDNAGGKSRKNAPTKVFNPVEVEEHFTRYLQLQLARLGSHAARQLMSALKDRMSQTLEKLQQVRCELAAVLSIFSSTTSPDRASANGDGTPSASDVSHAVVERIQSYLPKLAKELDEQFRQDLLGDGRGLAEVLQGDFNIQNSLPEPLSRAARGVIMNARKSENIIDLLLPADEDPEQSINRLCHCFKAANPRLAACGGGKRLLLAVPRGASYEGLQKVLEQGLDESVSVAFNNVGDVVLCCELGQISPEQIGARLVDERPDYAELAARLHTRNDVNWSPWAR